MGDSNAQSVERSTHHPLYRNRTEHWMPQLFQGDIFEAVFGFDLAIVFGHLGFNEMKGMWDRFRDRTASARCESICRIRPEAAGT